MHDATLMDLLGEVFTTHGYDCTRQAALEGRSGTVYTIPLLAESEERAVIVDADLGSDPLAQEAVAAVEDVMHDVGADHAVLCHLGTVASDLDATDVALWGQDMLLHVIGDAQVSQAVGTTPEPLRFHTRDRQERVPIAESLDEILPDAFHETGDTAPENRSTDATGTADGPTTDTAGPETRAAEFQGAVEETGAAGAFDLDALEHLGQGETGHAASDGPSAAEDPRQATGAAAPLHRGDDAPHRRDPSPLRNDDATPLHHDGDAPLTDDGMPEPAPAFAHPVLPVRITSDEARIAIQQRLETVDSVQMALQPVHLIDYECDLLAEGSLRYDTVQGRVQVHGTDKTVTEVDPEAVDPQGFTRMPRLPGLPNHERTLRVSDTRARERTTDFLMENHARVVDVEVDDEDNGFSYTEKKQVAPRPDHVRLDPLGTYHRVIWRFVGPQGHIDVDALSGEVVEEVLQHPHTDSMMIE